MGGNVVTFSDSRFGELRSLNIKGEPWFVGKDVAMPLGYANIADAIKKHVDDEDKGIAKCDTLGGKQSLIVINESGLYSLILSSKLPKAREFKRWVTNEVLPQIRQTGGYIPIKQGETDAELMARALMIAQKTIAQKDKLLEEQKPKVIFAEAVVASEADILIRDLAKILTQRGIKVGQNRLFKWLRQNGYLFQHENRPIQVWVEKGIFSTTVSLIETHHGQKERCTTKITGAGQQYFINGFLSGRFTL